MMRRGKQRHEKREKTVASYGVGETRADKALSREGDKGALNKRGGN